MIYNMTTTILTMKKLNNIAILEQNKTLWERTLRRRGCGLIVHAEEW